MSFLQWLEGRSPEHVRALGRFVHAQACEQIQSADSPRALDAHANATVTLAGERIIPRTDTPGATDAGVASFIDHIVGNWYSPTERDRMLKGLQELDARSHSLHGADFVDCPDARRLVRAVARRAPHH